MPTIQILPLHTTDVPAVVALWYRCTCQHHAFISEKYWQEITPRITGLLHQYHHSSLIAVSERHIVGFITAIAQELAALFVDSSVQRTGIGSLLLRQLQQQVFLSSVKVYAANTAAMAFYHQHGFNEQSRQLQRQTNQILITMQR